MGTLTISSQYGSGGREVGLQAATALGYRFIDRELVVRVAEEAGVPAAEVAPFDERPEHPLMRALRRFLLPAYPHGVDEWGTQMLGHTFFWEPGMPPWREDAVLLDEDEFVKFTQKVFLHLAARGNVVIIGRGAQAYLRSYPGALHVHTVAPEGYRAGAVAREEGMDRAAALRLARKRDTHAARFHRRHYGLDWRSPDLYHLVLNVAEMGVGGASRAVVAAVRHTSSRPRPVEA